MPVIIVIILAIASIGFANAAPSALKKCQMVYWTSEEGSRILPVPGNQVSGFKLKLDPTVEWYYLDTESIKPQIPIPADLPFGWDLFIFYLDPNTYAENAEFAAYWGAKLSEHAGELWTYHMMAIIDGYAPMFFLRVTPEGEYTLWDGLQCEMWLDENMEGPEPGPLRVNGDYPHGTYVFTCQESMFGNDYLTGITITITFK